MKTAVYEMGDLERCHFAEYAKRHEVELVTTEKALTLDNVALASGCQGVSILGHSRMDRELFCALKELGVRYLSTRTIGFDHIDLDAAAELGIQVRNSSYPPDGVAEFTVMLMLLVLRRYKPALWKQQVNDYSLEGLMGRELNAQTVGVMGTGRIGAAVVRILKGFGCRVLVFDREEDPEVSAYAEYTSLENLYSESDIITMHIPNLPETHHIINYSSIEKMKEGVILINTARGELIHTDALIAGIESGKIGGLGLDVLAEERGVYHHNRKTEILSNKEMAYLRQFPNVVLTQHIAFFTDRDVKEMVLCSLRGLEEMALQL